MRGLDRCESGRGLPQSKTLARQTGPVSSRLARVGKRFVGHYTSAFPAVFGRSKAVTFKGITGDPKRMNGQPCVRQLRLTVRRVVEAVATYPDRRDLQREFPELEAEDIREALAYAAANLDDKVIELATAG
jgi:uncharacterized protein (DUF433 family)